MKKDGIKKVSLVKILNIHRQYRNRKSNDDFGPGLIISKNTRSIQIFLTFILFGIFVDNKIKKVRTLVNFFDIVLTAKTGPGYL